MVFLCLDDLRSVEIKVSRPEAVKNCMKRLHVDVSRMGRNKRLRHLKNILKRGRQEEGLENRMVGTSQRLLRADDGKNSHEKELLNKE